jgi:cytochrome b involved in lipid metabolism
VLVAAGGYFFMQEEAKEAEAKTFMNEYKAEPVTEATTTGTGTAEVVKTSFTLAEVAAHSSATDCWMVINSDVLNVSAFVSKHPGGEVITNGCGKDATEYFNNVPKHLRGVAQSWLGKLKIGTLAQ